jgi:hypothetical protein
MIAMNPRFPKLHRSCANYEVFNTEWFLQNFVEASPSDGEFGECAISSGRVPARRILGEENIMRYAFIQHASIRRPTCGKIGLRYQHRD